ncbi:hypothetical protein A2U01_0109813 [Trifolium medium]|uniref:Uncharacterized protein n=1 Tax=Trifolium medium TaxID=97028 RepID=A0A392VJI7_9FABA|nr:hypothetical protein [Trifolium medium]
MNPRNSSNPPPSPKASLMAPPLNDPQHHLPLRSHRHSHMVVTLIVPESENSRFPHLPLSEHGGCDA